MASVWWVDGDGGIGDERVISSASWLSQGIVAETVKWNAANGWSVSHSKFTSEQLDLLDRTYGFRINQPDGPRTWPDPPGPIHDESFAQSSYVYYKAIKDLYASLEGLTLAQIESAVAGLDGVSKRIKEQVRPGGYIANSYYYCDYSKTVLNAFAADRLRLIPFIVTDSISVASLFIDVTTAAAGSNVLAAIYDDDGNGKPLNRKCWSTISTAATGIIEGSVGTPATLQPGLHWGGGIMRGTNVPTLRAVTDPALGVQIQSPGNPGVSPTSGDAPISWALATVSGDPPVTLGSGLFTANAAVPRIGFKVAA